nr:hypothetical protein [Gammaproteobacteria bacterium]
YTNLVLGRPCRFSETVKRIIAPTKPSLKGDAKLIGSPLTTYRKRIWKPRIRNFASGMLMIIILDFNFNLFIICSLFIEACSQSDFPPKLFEYGLNENLFTSCFHAFQAEISLPWKVKGIPDIGFYKALHPYMKKFKQITIINVGKFYIAIDPNLKGGEPFYVYQLIETVFKSKKPEDKRMVYDKSAIGIMTDAGSENQEIENNCDFNAMKDQLRSCTKMLEEITAESLELKQNFHSTRNKLQVAEGALRDITNEKFKLEKRCHKSVKKLKFMEAQNTRLENDFAEMQIENLDLSEDMMELQQYFVLP